MTPSPLLPHLIDRGPAYTFHRLLRSRLHGRGLQYLVDWEDSRGEVLGPSERRTGLESDTDNVSSRDPSSDKGDALPGAEDEMMEVLNIKKD